MVSYTSSEKIMKQEHNRSNQYDHVHQSSKIMKKPPASAPPTIPQPKVYKVKPIHFRELVQQLTGAQQQQPNKSQPKPQRHSNLQAVAPAPLQLHPHQLQLQLQLQTQASNSSEKQVECKPFAEKLQNNGVGTTELILSPNFQAWFSFAMLSPGVGPPNMSHMEQASLR